MFLEISQNSQENTCARVSFLIKLPLLITIKHFLTVRVGQLILKNSTTEQIATLRITNLQQVHIFSSGIKLFDLYCVSYWLIQNLLEKFLMGFLFRLKNSWIQRYNQETTLLNFCMFLPFTSKNFLTVFFFWNRQVFYKKIWQISEGNTCARVSLLIKLQH